ncbi:MAG: hypothetical protein AB1546_02680 [bacterium]
MSNPVARAGIFVNNLTRRGISTPVFNPKRSEIIIPDEKIQRRIIEGLAFLASTISFPIGYRFRHRWCPSAHNRTSASAAESILNALTIMYFSPETALEIIRNFFVNQSLEGCLPRYLSPMSSSPHPAVPLLLLPVLIHQNIEPDNEKLDEFYNRAIRFSDYLAVHRKREDGLFHPRAAADLQTDFILIKPVHETENASPEKFTSVALNCLMAHQFRLLSKAARCLSYPREERKFEVRAKKLGSLIAERCWIETQKNFFDLIDGKHAAAPSPAAALTLTAEAASKEQAKTIAEQLKNNRQLLQPANHTDLLALYLTLEGLVKYGLHAAAGDAALQCLKHIAVLPRTQENLLLAAASFPVLMEYIIGFHPFRDRCVISPHLPDEWKNQKIEVSNLAQRISLAVTLLEAGKVKCEVVRGERMEAEINNFHFMNFIYQKNA